MSEHTDPYCLTHCIPGVKHSQCGCYCDHNTACDWGGCDRRTLAGAFCNFHADEYERVVAERGKEWAE